MQRMWWSCPEQKESQTTPERSDIYGACVHQQRPQDWPRENQSGKADANTNQHRGGPMAKSICNTWDEHLLLNPWVDWEWTVLHQNTFVTLNNWLTSACHGTLTHLHLPSCTSIQLYLVWEQSWPTLGMAELDQWLMPVVPCLTWSADTHKCKGKPWQLFGAARSSISISTWQNLMWIQISSPSRWSTVPNTNITGCFPTV